MIRFRNPVSDIGILIENFRKMYEDFVDFDYFDLDNIAEFCAREKLVSSSGYIGDEALKRSYAIKEDSRKSMKMQAKSYAELFRALGWIKSVDKSLHFNFSFLGMHIAVSGIGAYSLFEQCLLGMEYQNHELNVKFSDINKPFINILFAAQMLDGYIYKHEIMLGPMSMSNGYSREELNKKITYIKELRKSGDLSVLKEAFQKLADSENMQVTSVDNVTRFICPALLFVGWFRKVKMKTYGRSMPFLQLTPKGERVISMIKKSIVIKGDSLNLEDEYCKEISELALLSMFKRANFEVEEEIKKYDELLNTIKEKYKKEDVLFSPYQFFSKNELENILPQYSISGGIYRRDTSIDAKDNFIQLKSEMMIKAKESIGTKNENICNELLDRIRNANLCVDDAVEVFLREIEKMKQDKCYPLIADLLGFIFDREAFAPPAGNNNMRYDVMIPDETYSIPVEVKSPTEIPMISTKAIRQALENKVLLLARKPFPTTYEISSFACGFLLPNDRSDVYKMIEEIHETYGINIAILDMESIIRAAFACAQTKSYYEISDFIGKRGVINFENI